jgi:hypothetical protein
MTRTGAKIASASQSSRVRVQHLLCWASIQIVLCAAGLQNVAARKGVGLYSALHVRGSAARPKASVRSELSRRQAETGLTIAWYEDGLNAVSFRQRSATRDVTLPFLTPKMSGAVSSDGMQVAGNTWDGSGRLTLGIVRSDGSEPREYPGMAPLDFCWSHDKSKLALTFHKSRIANLGVLDLTTRATRILIPNVEEARHFTSQCWSRDDKQVVYEMGGSVHIIEIAKGIESERVIVRGLEPTWSPDGNWVAYRDGDAYDAIHPSGEGQKTLFRKTRAVSALFWSPDSRFVAYVHQEFFALDVEFYHLMVRRLEDGSEDWIANGVSCCINYEWVTSPQLLEQVKSEATSH